MRFAILASLSCLPLGTACLDEVDEEVEDEENLSTTESTLCTDGWPEAYVAFDDQGGESTATSDLPTDGYAHRGCLDWFTVEVTGVDAATHSFSATGGWGESLPTNKTECELAIANIKMSEYAHTGWDCSSGPGCVPTYGWVFVGEGGLRGSWQQNFFTGAFTCRMVESSPLPKLQIDTSRTRVRVSVRAYAWALFFPVYKRGKAGVYSAPIIY